MILHLLLQQWDEIEAKMKTQDSPCFLYQEPDLIGLTARDFLTDDIDRVQIDRKEDYNRLSKHSANFSQIKIKSYSSLMKKSPFSKDLMLSVKLNRLSCAGFSPFRW